METSLFEVIREFRNEFAHSLKKNNFEDYSLKLKDLGLSISPEEIPEFLNSIHEFSDRSGGIYYFPKNLKNIISLLLEGRPTETILDPWAGIGISISAIQNFTHSSKTFALTPNQEELEFGKKLTNNIIWKSGNPIDSIRSLEEQFDVIFSILPMGMRPDETITLKKNGQNVAKKTDIGNFIIAESSKKLKKSGMGLFIVPASFFFSSHSVFKSLNELELGIEAALLLPSRTFAPYTNIPIYLIVVRNSPVKKMFVAKLSGELNTDNEILTNFKNHREGGKVELGCFINPSDFTGIEPLINEERLQQKTSLFGASAKKLEELSSQITLGRFGEDFEFSHIENAIYIPIVGNSDVVDSLERLKIKQQNYVQVVVDSSISDARFVTQFLNSELGKEFREQGKAGTVIPKLNKQTIKNLPILVPDISTQKIMLDIEGKIIAEQNIVLSLQSELNEYKRELWSNPKSIQNVDQRLSILSRRLSGNVKLHAENGLDQWAETLPFPLASILRAWQATPNQDFKTKYEYLLHFFEATAEFASIIFISAYHTNPEIFHEHERKISEILQKQKLSFNRASFGTWKVIVEYLGKQTRDMLKDERKMALCADLFSDPSLILPETISNTEFIQILSTTNKMRNDWKGHGGVIGPDTARMRNELLISELQKLRKIMADLWKDFQLIHAINCRPRRGLFENEVAILTGSNSEFLKDTKSMNTWLDVERLYLWSSENNKALQLMPLVQVGPSPRSVNNACYFYNRLEQDGARFVSYHYIDDPDFVSPVKNLEEIKGLFGGI